MADWKYVPEFVYEQVLAVSGVCLRGPSGPFSSWAALWRRTNIGVRTQWSGQVRLPSQQECAGLRKVGYLRRAEYSWSGQKRTLRHSRIEPTLDDPIPPPNFTILPISQFFNLPQRPQSVFNLASICPPRLTRAPICPTVLNPSSIWSQSAPGASQSGLNLPQRPQSVLNLASICPGVFNLPRIEGTDQRTSRQIEDMSRNAGAN